MGKTSERRRRQQERIEAQRRSGKTFAAVSVGLIAIVVAAVTVGVSGGDAGPSNTQPKGRFPERSGAAAALQVEADAETVALGRVPLNTTVTPTWQLVNHGDTDVALGQPHAEVIEGCCPGPLKLGTPALAPGEATKLTFPLQMHEGMDGPHEFALHIPIERNGVQDILELTTTGDFSD